jgi:hypothetical protein
MGSLVVQSIIVMVGLFITFCIGIHTGQEGSDEEWIESASEKRPIVKKGKVFEVKCIGGE